MMYKYPHKKQNSMTSFFIGAAASTVMFLGYEIYKHMNYDCCDENLDNYEGYEDYDDLDIDGDSFQPEYASSAFHVKNVSRCRRTHNLIKQMNHKVNGNSYRCKMRKKMYNRN